MKTIIAGSRGIANPELIAWCVRESGFEITEVVSGGARGVDTLGADWARINSIPVKVMLANWKPHGEHGRTDRAAGIKRNCEMAIYGDALIAIWDGKSPGTKHMIKAARDRDLKVFVHDTLKYYRQFQTG